MKWLTPALGQIATITGGSTPNRTQAEYWNGSIPWLTPTDLPMPGKGIADVSDTAGKITEEGLAAISAQLLPVGTVLFSSRATIGKLAISRVPLATNQGFANFIPKKFVDAKYLAYCLLHYTAEITALAGSTTFKEVTKTALKKFKVPLPALSEQRRIVEILDQADALRKKRAEANAKAARILPALFYKMFGDPLANLHSFPIETVGNLLILLRNGTTAEQNQDGHGYPVTRIETISEGVINPDRVRYGDFDNSELKKWRLEPGDILFSHINSESHIGKTAIYKGQPDPLIHGMNLLLMRPDARQVRPEYLFAVLNTNSVRAAYRQRCKRAVNQASLNQKDISSLEVGVPPIDSQDRFCQLANTLLPQVEAQQKATEKIKRLFDNLLHRAFTGDLTAKWREARMKELLAEMEAQAKALECPPTKVNPPEIGSKRHAGHDMYSKAALAAYITDRCHAPDRPLGRVKLAKLFYLVQQKAEIELTQTFMKRAAGSLDDEIHKFLSLAQKSKWLVLCRGEGDLKPVKPGANVSKAIEQAQKLLGPAKAKVDEMLDQMKGWGYRALERWATVLDASFELTAAGQSATVEGVKDVIQKHPEWVPKLDRDEFSDTNIEAALKGLRGFGFITNHD